MTDEAKLDLRKRASDFVWDLAKAILLPAAISGIAWLGHRFGRLAWFDLPLRQKPWFLASVIYLLTLAVVLLTAWLWGVGIPARVRELYRDNRRRLLARLSFSFVIPIPFALSLAFLVSPSQLQGIEGEKLFPQATDLGPVFIRTFANNGETSYQFIDETPVHGPHSYARISLTADDDQLRDNAGWVLYFIRGADISDQRQLRFFIRGESGSEKIGIKMKDAQGREVSVLLDGRYLLQGRITTDWQEVSIPLSNFPKVNFKVMDCLTLFTDGSIASTVPQTVYVGGFSLLKSERVAL